MRLEILNHLIYELGAAFYAAPSLFFDTILVYQTGMRVCSSNENYTKNNKGNT